MVKSFLISIFLTWTVFAEPRRIVSTTPSLTEIAFALGLGPRVVGVTTFCHYPAEVLRLPKIGSYSQPNMEVVASLRPDLVLVEKNPRGFTAKLQGMGLPVLEVEAQRMETLPAAIRAVAAAGGVSPDPVLRRLEGGLAEMRRRVGARRTRVLFIVGRTPGSLEGLIAAGPGSYIDALLAAAGGVNVFADTRSSYPRVSLEEVLARRPEVIIDMGDMSDTVGVTAEHRRSVEALWRRFPAIQARVYAVADDIFVVPGPRAVDAVRAFGRLLHPGLGL